MGGGLIIGFFRRCFRARTTYDCCWLPAMSERQKGYPFRNQGLSSKLDVQLCNRTVDEDKKKLHSRLNGPAPAR